MTESSPSVGRSRNRVRAAIEAIATPKIQRRGLGQRWRVTQQSKQLLTSLGDTADEIARHLWEAGVSGVPQNPFECALSRYLAALIPASAEVEEIAVGRINRRTGRTQLILRLTAFPRWTVRIELGEHVQEFLVAFDAGTYPELIRHDRAVIDSSDGRMVRVAKSS